MIPKLLIINFQIIKLNPIQPTTSKMDSTYLCESPAASSVKPFSSIQNKAFTSYDVTPLQPLKLKVSYI